MNRNLKVNENVMNWYVNGGKEKIAEYIRTYKNAGGIVLIATHDVMELELCDEYYIIKNGKLLPFDYDGNLSRLVKALWDIFICS